MGYKLLGFAVWQGGKWYLRRKLRRVARKAAIATVAAVVVGGLIAASRQHSSD